MKLNKWVVYLLLIILLSFPFVAYRIFWIASSIRTEATVAYIRTVGFRHSPGHKQPIFRYETEKYVWEVGSNYNIPYSAGDIVPILYNPRNESNFKIDTVWYCWKDLLYWGTFPFIFITMIFCANDIIPSTLVFGRRNSKL